MWRFEINGSSPNRRKLTRFYESPSTLLKPDRGALEPNPQQSYHLRHVPASSFLNLIKLSIRTILTSCTMDQNKILWKQNFERRFSFLWRIIMLRLLLNNVEAVFEIIVVIQNMFKFNILAYSAECQKVIRHSSCQNYDTSGPY